MLTTLNCLTYAYKKFRQNGRIDFSKSKLLQKNLLHHHGVISPLNFCAIPTLQSYKQVSFSDSIRSAETSKRAVRNNKYFFVESLSICIYSTFSVHEESQWRLIKHSANCITSKRSANCITSKCSAKCKLWKGNNYGKRGTLLGNPSMTHELAVEVRFLRLHEGTK